MTERPCYKKTKLQEDQAIRRLSHVNTNSSEGLVMERPRRLSYRRSVLQEDRIMGRLSYEKTEQEEN